MQNSSIVLALGVVFMLLALLGLWVTASEPVEILDARPGSGANPLPYPARPVPALDASLPAAVPSAALVAQPPAVEGNMPNDDVQAAISAVTPLVRQCFEDVAARYPGEQRVTLRFVAAGGRTPALGDAAVTQATLRDPYLEACLADAVTEAPLPRPLRGEPTTISVPFVFTGHRAATP